MDQKKENRKVNKIPFQIVGEDELKELQKKKERIEEIMSFIKEEGLDQDEEFMKEVEDAIKSAL